MQLTYCLSLSYIHVLLNWQQVKTDNINLFAETALTETDTMPYKWEIDARAENSRSM